MDCGEWNIRVNCVCPGMHTLTHQQTSYGADLVNTGTGTIDTPATDSHAKHLGITKDELVAQTVTQHFIKRLGSTDDVAKCVLFLASDESTFISGAAIPVDGGVLAQ
jgi:NAD(P)-dependent dehydrogenase (short-subunit alcohol dehydrogenase family)